MGASLQNILNRLETKTDTIVGHCLALKEEIARLTAENEALREEISELQDLRTHLSIENESLRVSHKIASTPDDLIASRRHIARLVRDIDKCISQLKE